ncbi:MAG: IS4 family transposase, partial [Bryobacteraceae bacterium]
VAILKKRLGLEASLYKILQILSVTLFEKMPILQAFEGTDYELFPEVSSNQLTLFDL